jgi:iron complex transport system substrate-binding protein
MKKYIFFVLPLIVFSCQSNSYEKDADFKEESSIFNENDVRYAEGFTIEKFDLYKVLTLTNAWNGDDLTFRYVLYNDVKPDGVKGDVFIKTPIKSIACMSLTHIAFIEKLGLEKSIVALSGCDYVSSSKIRGLISEESIKEIGVQQNTNFEMLVEEAPDFVMGYGIDATSNNYINKLKTLGLDVVLNSEYMETSPLGKTEWIKFVAAFYNKEELADSIFNEIEKEYLTLLELTKSIKEKPTVFAGMPWNGAWYIPGANSFQTQFFKDAGAEYLWLDNDEKSSLVKDKEVIINDAYDADFWLNQNSYKSEEDIVAFDEKFKGFNAVKKHQLFNNDRQVNGASGNDYWESGVVSPDIVLKDLIEIFHPDLIDHQLFYYRNLE